MCYFYPVMCTSCIQDCTELINRFDTGSPCSVLKWHGGAIGRACESIIFSIVLTQFSEFPQVLCSGMGGIVLYSVFTC